MESKGDRVSRAGQRSSGWGSRTGGDDCGCL